MPDKNNRDLKHFLGHRKRMKDKFISSQDSSVFADYELLEMLLFFSIPRKDVKPLAKALLARFGSLQKIINAEKEEIMSLSEMSYNSFVCFQLVKEILTRIFKNKITTQHIISSWQDLLKYLKFTMSDLTIEHFRVIFLNSQKLLLSDELVSKGTIDQTVVYPREILKRALAVGARSLVLVHNHPGGSVNPSNADLLVTAKIQDSCEVFNISLHDHVIIGNNKYYSFKDNHLL